MKLKGQHNTQAGSRGGQSARRGGGTAMAAMCGDAAGHSYKAFAQDEAPTFTSCVKSRPPIDPEAACWCSTQEDFIVFSEFSEITGPIPLITIPAYIENNVNINSLIMNIMSLDYQGNTGGQFKLCEDAQVLQSDVLPGLHVYAHYTSLSDVKARGFVRPLCIAYVSPDRQKLDQELLNIRETFLQMTKIMKYDNRQWFLSEIFKVLASLHEAKTRYFELKQQEDGAALSEEEAAELSQVDLAQLVAHTSEYRHMSHWVERHLEADGDEAVRSELASWEAGLEAQEGPQVAVYLGKARSDRRRERAGRGVMAGVPALCPYGVAAAVWRLMGALQQFGYCRLELPLTMWPQEEPRAEDRPAGRRVEEALGSMDFLQLLHNMATATAWDACAGTPLSPRGSSDGDSFKASAENLAEGALCFLDKGYLPSGTEGSSSYYSAPESVAGGSEHSEETLPAEGEDCPSEDSWSYDEDDARDDQVTARPVCIWGQQSLLNQPGHGILKFFKSYQKAALHVVYSVLIGRTVVVCGGKAARRRVSQIITVLMALVPVGSGKQLRVLRWHCGILVASHITEYQLIGLCVPERLSVYDMVGHQEKNRVTILSARDGRLFGRAYAGRLLSSLEQVAARQPCDQSLLLYLRVLALSLEEKLLVFRGLAGTRPGPGAARAALRGAELEGCDAEVVRYLDTVLP
ncbi:uncharacterized protein LOC134533710 isoform X2 [Bacillus rossius redtenbacheri]|uniref:uncharacterized protein LOC134533710 isoform X2 n=1 Tax=Bacillus rossius redtenbacheri TaxID=93214 RepID=UPI002FDE2F13